MHEYGAATEQYRVLLLRFISRRNPLLQHGIGISPPRLAGQTPQNGNFT